MRFFIDFCADASRLRANFGNGVRSCAVFSSRFASLSASRSALFTLACASVSRLASSDLARAVSSASRG
jgi:hypothetical protein